MNDDEMKPMAELFSVNRRVGSDKWEYSFFVKGEGLRLSKRTFFSADEALEAGRADVEILNRPKTRLHSIIGFRNMNLYIVYLEDDLGDRKRTLGEYATLEAACRAAIEACK